jgi:hypothetical protein
MLFAATFQQDVKEAQHKLGLGADGVIGPNTYAAMRGHGLLDGYAAWLLRNVQLPPQLTEFERRQRNIVNTALYEVKRAGYIHYSQGTRRMEMITHRMRPPAAGPDQQFYTDCSAFDTWLRWLYGCPDPNGLGYNGYGFTGTMIQHGTVVSFNELQPCDLVFYGHPVSHVAMVVYRRDGRVWIVSHGSEDGPYLLPMLYRADINHCRRYQLV